MKMQIFVMPAWMPPETSMSIWIPALHAGMTESRVLLELTEAPPPRIFKGDHEGHEDRREVSNVKRIFSTFVLFVCFVVVSIFQNVIVQPRF
jgi:hypothetical protein